MSVSCCCVAHTTSGSGAQRTLEQMQCSNHLAALCIAAEQQKEDHSGCDYHSYHSVWT